MLTNTPNIKKSRKYLFIDIRSYEYEPLFVAVITRMKRKTVRWRIVIRIRHGKTIKVKCLRRDGRPCTTAAPAHRNQSGRKVCWANMPVPSQARRRRILIAKEDDISRFWLMHPVRSTARCIRLNFWARSRPLNKIFFEVIHMALKIFVLVKMLVTYG